MATKKLTQLAPTAKYIVEGQQCFFLKGGLQLSSGRTVQIEVWLAAPDDLTPKEQRELESFPVAFHDLTPMQPKERRVSKGVAVVELEPIAYRHARKAKVATKRRKEARK